MSEPVTPDLNALAAAALRKSLNAHGYGLQFAALKKCVDHSSGQQLPHINWILRVSEFPVEL